MKWCKVEISSNTFRKLCCREGNLEESLLEELQENEGFAVNRRRGTAHVFDSGALNRFLAVNRMTYLIRAHEVQQAGVQVN